jgi:hypothetical protein
LEHETYLNEPVVGFVKPNNGFTYVLARNSIWVAVFTGAIEGPPVMLRPVIEKVGCRSQQAATTVGEALYFFSSAGIPGRITPDGRLDEGFGERVSGFMKTWDPTKVVVSYHERRNTVAYMHGTYVLLYEIDKDRWSAPIDNTQVDSLGRPEGTIASAFSQDGTMIVSVWNGAAYDFWAFDRNVSQGSNWVVATPWTTLGFGMLMKDVVGFIMHTYSGSKFNAPLSNWSVSVRGNLVESDFGTVFILPAAENTEITEPYRGLNAPHLRYVKCVITGSGVGQKVRHFEIDYVIHGMRQ